MTELTGLILNGEGDFLGYRNTLFAEYNLEPLKDVLTRILADKKGWELTRDWMLPYAVDLVSEEVHSEMEDEKSSLRMYIREVTTEFAHSWDTEHTEQIMGLVVEKITQEVQRYPRVRFQRKITNQSKKIRRRTFTNEVQSVF